MRPAQGHGNAVSLQISQPQPPFSPTLSLNLPLSLTAANPKYTSACYVLTPKRGGAKRRRMPVATSPSSEVCRGRQFLPIMMHFALYPQAMRSIAGGVGEQCSPAKKPKAGVAGRRLSPAEGVDAYGRKCAHSGVGGNFPLLKSGVW